MSSSLDPRMAAETLKSAERYGEAADQYRLCLDRTPDDFELLYEYGEVLVALGRLDEAADSFRRALIQAPGDAACTIRLADVLHRQNKTRDALHYYRRASRLAPQLAQVHLMAGITAMAAELPEEARAAFARALEIDPDNDVARNCCAMADFTIGAAAVKAGLPEKARMAFNRTLENEPDNIIARLCSTMLLFTIYSGVTELEERRRAYAVALKELVSRTRLETPDDIDKAVTAVGQILPFYLPYQGRNDRELQKLYGSWVDRIMRARYPQYGTGLARPSHDDGKLRVAIVSAYFCNHSNWKIPIKGWLKHLDRTRFSIFSYYTGDKSDPATDEARRLSDVFIQTKDLTLLVEMIARQRPDVVIYPGLSMDLITMKVAALRLAPVQCTSWGHPETSGLPNMDYFLSSDLMEPPDGDKHYSEKLVRLPNLSICYEQVPLPENLPLVFIPGINKGDISFLCCQNLVKFLPEHDDVFPAIAARLPQARFVFIKFSEEHSRRFRRRLDEAFARQGLSAADHVIFAPHLNNIGYATINAVTDIFLDSIGWSGCNTVFESLPFNKPIVTLPGEFMRGRHAAAILRMMGVEETIAGNKQEYVDIAVRLATDRDWYEAVVSRIAARKHRVYADMTCITALEDFLITACGKE